MRTAPTRCQSGIWETDLIQGLRCFDASTPAASDTTTAQRLVYRAICFSAFSHFSCHGMLFLPKIEEKVHVAGLFCSRESSFQGPRSRSSMTGPADWLVDCGGEAKGGSAERARNLRLHLACISIYTDSGARCWPGCLGRVSTTLAFCPTVAPAFL